MYTYSICEMEVNNRSVLICNYFNSVRLQSYHKFSTKNGKSIYYLFHNTISEENTKMFAVVTINVIKSLNHF